MKNIQFTGVRCAIFTPLNEDSTVKREAVKPLVDFTLDRGVKGFYVAGSTGEGPILNQNERKAIVEETIKAAKSRKTVDGETPDVIVHVAAPYTPDAFDLAKFAKDAGADCISSLAPNFYGAAHTKDEVLDYYKRLADATDLPLLVYATPILTNSIKDLKGFFEEAMQIDNVIGLKYTIRDYYNLSVLKQINGGDINIINGPDETLLGGLAMGADGGIGSTYNFCPELFVNIWNKFHAGDIEGARKDQDLVNSIITTFIKSKGGYLTACKAALRIYGIDLGQCAYPCVRYDDSEIKALKERLVDAGMKF